ncbi:MAG: ABC transporter permease [Chloroflexi bacterium]|nr:MAG: ABC transporter permease [Chloroflexota bacterium]
MWSYIARRAIQALFTLLIITIVCFILTRLSADPLAQYATNPNMSAADRAALRERLGLNQPLPVQYLKWIGLVVQGDFGQSFFSKQPVLGMIAQRLPLTLILMITAEVFTLAIALVLGIISAVKQYSLLDNIVTSFSFVGFSMPIFFIALGLMLIFAVKFKQMGWPYLPTGADIWDHKNLGQLARHMVLPVTALVIIQTANYSRFVRSSILEVLGLDYVRTARAKGLTERAVLYKHALRNAALPFVTIVGLDIPSLLGGALVTESIFAWPGMGRLFWEYAQRGDFPVVNGVLLIVSSAVVLFTIITDLVYTVVDPRIRLS